MNDNEAKPATVWLMAFLLLFAGIGAYLWLESRQAEAARLAEAEAQAAQKQQEAELAAARQQVIDAAKSLVTESQRLEKGGAPTIRGKAVIWNVEDNCLDAATEQLPADLRGTFADSPLTLVLVVETNLVRRASYGGAAPITGGASDIVRDALRKAGVKDDPSAPPADTGIPGYRVDQKVCIIHWPEKKAVGWAVVEGKEPPSEVFLGKDDKEYRADRITPLVEWVAKLPKAN
jgi:hypothetical protein